MKLFSVKIWGPGAQRLALIEEQNYDLLEVCLVYKCMIATIAGAIDSPLFMRLSVHLDQSFSLFVHFLCIAFIANDWQFGPICTALCLGVNWQKRSLRTKYEDIHRHHQKRHTLHAFAVISPKSRLTLWTERTGKDALNK